MAVVAQAKGVYAVGTTSFVADVPAGIAANDILVIIAESSDGTTTAGTPNTPAGWTKIFERTEGAGATGVTTLTIFAKVATGSETDVTVDGVGNHISGNMFAIRGAKASVAGTELKVGTGTGAASGNMAAVAGITVDEANCLGLLVGGTTRDATGSTTWSSWASVNGTGETEWEDNNTNTGAGGGIGVAWFNAPSSGSTGDGSATIGVSAQWNGVQLIFEPLAVTVVERSAAIDGVGAIASVGAFFSVFERASALGAAGAVAVAGTFFSVFERSAAVGASASVAASGHSIVSASASLSATASIATTPQRELFRSASLGATASIASSGAAVAIFSRSAALSASASIASSGAAVPVFTRSASVDATAAIASSATFFSILERSSATSATGAVTVSGFTIRTRSASIDATAAITAGRLVVALRSASLEASAAVTVAGEVVIPGVVTRSASLNAVANISATPAPAHSRAAVLAATATVSVSGSVSAIVSRSASLEAVAAIAVSGLIPSPDVLEFPIGRAPVMTNSGVARLGVAAAPGLEVGSLDVPILASAGNGRILSPDDPRLEVRS